MANKHASTGPAGPQIEEPSHAERVRTLFSLGNTGTLATFSKKVAGYPFGSLMPYALDDAGSALFLISNMAMHTQNVKADPRASLFVAQTATDGDVLGAARATLVGDVLPVPAEATGAARERYLALHEGSRYWVDFSDFGFFRLTPAEIYYVGGFGVMGWVPSKEYAAATADPLTAASAGILQHLNSDHGTAMVTLAARYAGLVGNEAQMTGVDRLGFTLRVKTTDGMKVVRINFPAEVRTGEQVRTAMVEMLRQS